ncbi:MAG TPA: hypothetical protein VM123_15965 [archaeon]|nr:hypothetical protein [archaeon]
MKPTISIFLSILLFTLQNAEAKKTWEKDPYSWSEKDCQTIQSKSPWYCESYKPAAFGSDVYYLLKCQWVSPVIIFAEAREKQLKTGQTEEFLKQHFEEKKNKEGLTDDDIIVIRLFPMKGNGRRGQNLHSLYGNDPFFKEIDKNIILERNNNKDEFLKPVSFNTIENSNGEGFCIIFKNEDFITSDTRLAVLEISTEMGTFKLKFQPRMMQATEFEKVF